LGTALAEADVLFAEDTRRAATLLRSLGIKRPSRSYFAGNEAERVDELRAHLRAGRKVALITDAGTPAVADPGVSAVRAAREEGALVTVVPGPSAVTASLAVSGFGADRFVFEGFLPRKPGERRRRLTEIAGEERSVVLFASPHRLAADLTDLAEACGPERQVAVCRELTKAFEEVWWGSLSDAVVSWGSRRARGEFTLVLEGSRLGVKKSR
jgi:16S rRNA (cytidine1402-2'-O)-methyltransferase